MEATTSVVADAGLMIAVLDERDLHHAWAKEVLRATADRSLLASALTMAEALVRPANAGHGADAEFALRRLGFDVLPIVADQALALAEIRAATRLRMPDVVVLFAAEQTASALATTDAQLARVAAGRGLVVHAPPG